MREEKGMQRSKGRKTENALNMGNSEGNDLGRGESS